MYQIGDVYARSWMLAGTSVGSFAPKTFRLRLPTDGSRDAFEIDWARSARMRGGSAIEWAMRLPPPLQFDGSTAASQVTRSGNRIVLSNLASNQFQLLMVRVLTSSMMHGPAAVAALSHRAGQELPDQIGNRNLTVKFTVHFGAM